MRDFAKLRLKRWIASNRSTLPAKLVTFCCDSFLNSYHNLNYDFRSNGELTILRRLTSHNISCIFDVGANAGQWAIMARSVFPHASIYSFEIDCDVCRQHLIPLSMSHDIIGNCVGLSDVNAKVQVKTYPSETTLNGLFDYPHQLPSVIKEGEVITGDSFCAVHHVEHIDFLKIDVEGAEHMVMQGFTDMLRQGQIDIVQFEYGRANIISRWLLRDTYQFLQRFGYAVGKIFPEGVDFREYRLDDEDFRGPNYLAVRAGHPALRLLSLRQSFVAQGNGSHA